MREWGKQGEDAAGAGPRAGGDLIAKVPPAFLAVIGKASTEEVGALLAAHPQLASPIWLAVHQLRGNGFAQRAVAAIVAQPLHKPTPTVEPTPSPGPHDRPAPTATPIIDPARAKIVARQRTAGWDQLATAAPDERSTPTHIRLPPAIVQALDQAWQDTLATRPAHEQGGNLVRTYSGRYELQRTPNDSAHIFEQDTSDVGRLDTLVAQVHTHPYREEQAQVPEQFASFSDGDFDSLVRSEAHLSVLRSGPYTFILAKTTQFNVLVERLHNDESKLQALAAQMTATYDQAATATQGSFSAKVEAGVMAVCQQFHLHYYEGQGGDLTRKTRRPDA